MNEASRKDLEIGGKGWGGWEDQQKKDLKEGVLALLGGKTILNSNKTCSLLSTEMGEKLSGERHLYTVHNTHSLLH